MIFNLFLFHFYFILLFILKIILEQPKRTPEFPHGVLFLIKLIFKLSNILSDFYKYYSPCLIFNAATFASTCFLCNGYHNQRTKPNTRNPIPGTIQVTL